MDWGSEIVLIFYLRIEGLKKITLSEFFTHQAIILNTLIFMGKRIE